MLFAPGLVLFDLIGLETVSIYSQGHNNFSVCLHQMFLTMAINQRSEFHTMGDVVYLKNVIKV